VAVPACDGDSTVVDGEFVDVGRGGEVDGCGHGTVLMYPHQIIFQANRRWTFRKEFPCDS